MALSSSRTVPFINLPAQYAAERKELLPVIERVLASGYFIGGPEVEAFEAEVAEYCESAFAVSVNSGTDALLLGMEAVGIGPGDEVITPPNSFISSTSTIVRLGATPIFADVCEDELLDPNAVEAAITPRTAAIMAVHLRGGVARMKALREIARKNSLLLIEDAAQAVGSMEDGTKTGNLGDLGCFSAHPLKLLNATGDAGFITTNSADVASKIKRIRNAGLADREHATDWGTVSRMDAIQAAVLRFRLTRLDDLIAIRRRNAERYFYLLEGSGLSLPRERPGEFHTYNTFTVKLGQRNALLDSLKDAGIDAKVHYKIPLHLQPIAAELNCHEGQFPVTEKLSHTMISLPIHQFLDVSDLDYVAEKIKEFLSVAP